MISIVCAAFRAHLLDRVWESVKKQTYGKWELIFVNDGQQAVRDWYEKLKLEDKFKGYRVWMIDLEQPKGRFGLYSRNIGAMAANGSHILFLDDDNEWEPNHIESLVSLEKETGKVPYCWMHIKGKKPGSTFDKIKRTGISRQGIDLGCLLYKKKYFEQFGFFRDDAQVTFDFNAIERIYIGLGGADKFISTNLPTLIFHHKRY